MPATTIDQSTEPGATVVKDADKFLGSSGGTTLNFTRPQILTAQSGNPVVLQNSAGTATVTVNDDGSITITPASGKTVTVAGLDVGASTKVVAADATNATSTMANLTDLAVTLIAAHKYVGRAVLKCANSTAAEGIQFDLGGGATTATLFWAGAGVFASGGSDVVGTAVVTALGSAVTFTTLTGETVIVLEFYVTANAGGTLIPRFAEASAHASGTATVRAGSSLAVWDVT